MKIKKIYPAALYIFFCFFGVLNAFKPTILSGFSSMQADAGDTRLNHYFLEHSFQLLTNRNYVGELFSPAFFYPYKNVLTFSDNLFGSAPIYWALRALFDPDLSYQLWMILVCILCFISFAILMRHYRTSHVPTVIGAFLFAFGMPRLVQILHQQLLPQFFTPLAFLFVWNFIKSPNNKQLALSLILIYLQVLSGIYLGWFLIFSLMILIVIVSILDRNTFYRLTTYFKHNYKAVITITLTWALLMYGLLRPYINAKEILAYRSYAEVDYMLPRLSSWFLPAPDSLWWSSLSVFSKDLQMTQEHHLFLGFLVILLIGLSVYMLLFRQSVLTSERSFLIKVCLLVAFTLFILCIRLPNGWSLWRIIYSVIPGASAIRAVTRIWTIVYFYLIVAAILCLDSLIRTMLGKQVRMSILSLLCLGCLLEQIVINLPSSEKLLFTKEVLQIQELMQSDCNLAYVTLNPEKPYWVSHLSAMWAGIKANVPVVNGYSGNSPPNYSGVSKSMNTAQVINWLGEDSRGKLCIISQQSLKEKDKLIKMYSVKEDINSSQNLISYEIQLPIQKVFSQKIEAYAVPKTLSKDELLKIPLIITNTSNFLWSTIGKHPTNFSYRWLDPTGKLVMFDEDGKRTALPFDLSPGESVVINALIKTPTNPGKYSLVLTMVQESVAWFIDKEAKSLQIDVTITSNS
ncbi:hypothetical protein [aff. Roholtiella sp. LEGE 12411]|uniref:hypothetical protein n=1 Tax=aff. Roholtiella sp. LEGE 12411 TaxID=1828822 RepID=UPI00187EB3CF|nr:hypothetical protein [aff. Roholtiella sp. LEGE 12411]MBE9035241.1 hypothetical protein [aff. Roholtiella sp. LEGE 12411]